MEFFYLFLKNQSKKSFRKKNLVFYAISFGTLVVFSILVDSGFLVKNN